MRPQLLKITSGPSISFSARADAKPAVNNNWHYHPEVELIHVIKGEGTLFAGDTTIRFKPGDLILLGSNLPHYWRFDDAYTQHKPLPSFIELTQFCENFWGNDFLNLPENRSIRTLFVRAKKGIIVQEKIAFKAKKILHQLIEANGPDRLLLLLQLLSTLSKTGNCNYISATHSFEFDVSENERINAIYNYTLQHFKTKIYLKEVAAVANLSPNSFCRYFKSRTRKSFSTFVQELRVGYACKLLSENKMSIKEICFESGFNTFTHFNKQFKSIKDLKPNEYRKQMCF